ncbi:MAG: hypothetical protein NZ700_04125, partial [Gemmataceae bacterium]|nr:hypothetical protein [Gemmataceae bacterium]MDW8266984.1 hypothetical protein [Gemmataceae bacterium]
MRAVSVPRSRVLLLAAGLVVLAGTGLARAADEDALRQKALELNNVTGNDPIEGQIRALLSTPDATRKLLAVAVGMAKENPQPFHFNAAYILGRVAHHLKELDSAEVFYRLCVEHAVKLQSGQKLGQSFGALIDLYFEQKKYDKTVQACREFLDIRGNETVDRLKPAVLERMIQSLARQGKTDEALRIVDNLVKAEAEEDGWWFLQLRGWVLREADRLDEAAKTYETVLEKMTKDNLLKQEQKEHFAERTRYLLSSVYVDLND